MYDNLLMISVCFYFTLSLMFTVKSCFWLALQIKLYLMSALWTKLSPSNWRRGLCTEKLMIPYVLLVFKVLQNEGFFKVFVVTMWSLMLCTLFGDVCKCKSHHRCPGGQEEVGILKIMRKQLLCLRLNWISSIHEPWREADIPKNKRQQWQPSNASER